MPSLWPWLVLIGLGAFHGLNPAMGWLFAVALGMHQHSRRVVLVSLLPIALGHAAAIAIVVYAAVALGFAVGTRPLSIIGGLLLIGWGIYHAGGRRKQIKKARPPRPISRPWGGICRRVS
jgi:hypothetical protein